MRRITERLYPQALVREAATMEQVLAMARTGPPPRAFFLDLLFPGLDPRHSIGALRVEFERASIVVVSMTDDEGLIRTVMAEAPTASSARRCRQRRSPRRSRRFATGSS